VAGAVGAERVGEAAAVFSPMMMAAVILQIGMVGVAAGGLTGSVGIDVVYLSAEGWLEAAGGLAGAVAGDDELFEGFRGFVPGAAVVEQGAGQRVGDESAEDSVGGDESCLVGGDRAVSDKFAGFVAAEQDGVGDDDLDVRPLPVVFR